RDVLPAARWASAAARCDSCRPQRWEIAAAMWLAPTGAAGSRTWYVARALQRVARVHGRVAGHQVAVGPGTRLHARPSDGALRVQPAACAAAAPTVAGVATTRPSSGPRRDRRAADGGADEQPCTAAAVRLEHEGTSVVQHESPLRLDLGDEPAQITP